MSGRGDQAAHWAERVWDDRNGYFFYAFGVGGRLNEGKYKFEHFQQRHGTWPDDRERFLAQALERAERDDVYVAPYLRSKPSRKKGYALPSDLVYADLDRLTSLNGYGKLLIGPGGLLVNSGRGRHVYLRLPADLEPDELERLNRHLAAKLHADHGWSENKYLRLPGTWNYKGRAGGGEPWPVTILGGDRHERDWTAAELDDLLAPAVPTDAPTPARSPQPLGLDDEELLERARNAANGEKFCRLYDGGDRSGYKSASEATLALCRMLTFWTQDASQIDRLFRASGLMREKWDERRGDSTWGAQRIEKAVAETTEVYTPEPDRAADRTKAQRILDGEEPPGPTSSLTSSRPRPGWDLAEAVRVIGKVLDQVRRTSAAT